jgi:hypothetical protein
VDLLSKTGASVTHAFLLSQELRGSGIDDVAGLAYAIQGRSRGVGRSPALLRGAASTGKNQNTETGATELGPEESSLGGFCF